MATDTDLIKIPIELYWGLNDTADPFLVKDHRQAQNFITTSAQHLYNPLPIREISLAPLNDWIITDIFPVQERNKQYLILLCRQREMPQGASLLDHYLWVLPIKDLKKREFDVENLHQAVASQSLSRTLWKTSRVSMTVFKNEVIFAGIQSQHGQMVCLKVGQKRSRLNFDNLIPFAQCLVVHQDSLILGSTIDDPSVVRWSRIHSKEFDPEDWVKVGLEEDDAITGLASDSRGIVVFKKRGIWLIDGLPLRGVYKLTDIGTTGIFCKQGDTYIFLDTNKELWSFNMESKELHNITRGKLEKFMDSIYLNTEQIKKIEEGERLLQPDGYWLNPNSLHWEKIQTYTKGATKNDVVGLKYMDEFLALPYDAFPGVSSEKEAYGVRHKFRVGAVNPYKRFPIFMLKRVTAPIEILNTDTILFTLLRNDEPLFEKRIAVEPGNHTLEHEFEGWPVIIISENDILELKVASVDFKNRHKFTFRKNIVTPPLFPDTVEYYDGGWKPFTQNGDIWFYYFKLYGMNLHSEGMLKNKANLAISPNEPNRFVEGFSLEVDVESGASLKFHYDIDWAPYNTNISNKKGVVDFFSGKIGKGFNYRIDFLALWEDRWGIRYSLISPFVKSIWYKTCLVDIYDYPQINNPVLTNTSNGVYMLTNSPLENGRVQYNLLRFKDFINLIDLGHLEPTFMGSLASLDDFVVIGKMGGFYVFSETFLDPFPNVTPRPLKITTRNYHHLVGGEYHPIIPRYAELYCLLNHPTGFITLTFYNALSHEILHRIRLTPAELGYDGSPYEIGQPVIKIIDFPLPEIELPKGVYVDIEGKYCEIIYLSLFAQAKIRRTDKREEIGIGGV